MKTLMKTVAACAVFALGAAGAHAAGTNSADLRLKLHIVGGCTVSFEGGQSELELGSYSNLQEEVSRDGNLEIRCRGVSDQVANKISVGLDKGISGTNERRLLSGSGATIGYEVYKYADNTRGDVWGNEGDAVQSADLPTDTAAGGEVVAKMPFLVVVPAVKEGVASGDYTDTLKATVSYDL